MKNIKIAGLSMILAASSLCASATETRTYEVVHSQGQISTYFPGMQIEQITEGKVQFDYRPHSPEPTLESVSFDFGMAGRLKASDFSEKEYEPGVHRAIIEDVWVYRHVLVEVDVTNLPHIRLTVMVPEFQSYTAPIEHAHGPALYQGDVYLEDVTPSYTVDSKVVALDDDEVKLDLQNSIDWERSALVINTLWMGHGERQIHIPAEHLFPGESKPLAIQLKTFEGPYGPEHDISVTYENGGSYIEETQIQPLRMLLDEAYNTY